MLSPAMASTAPQADHHLLAEIEQLQAEIKVLQAQKEDLRLTLANIAEHGDILEAQLQNMNEQLQQEVEERRRAQSTLQALVSVLSRQRDDLEIVLQTIVEHGDVLDIQWQQQITQSTQLANSDSLTQVANRRRFDEYFALQWQSMQSAQAPLALVLCDIDFFKQYNDTYGHLAGDECLKQVAQTLSSALLRQSDLLARFGGEEFVAVLPQTNPLQALMIAQRMQAAINHLNIPHTGSQTHTYLTVSMGIAGTIPSSHRSAQHLLDSADRQLYLAKQHGRNQIVYTFLE
jgi:diguanylate cyclase (GGDEF)-like protein